MISSPPKTHPLVRLVDGFVPAISLSTSVYGHASGAKDSDDQLSKAVKRALLGGERFVCTYSLPSVGSGDAHE